MTPCPAATTTTTSGYKMIIRWDIESRSRCDLKTEGAWKYSRHPSTRILCFAWAIDGGPVRVWPDDSPEPFLNAIRSGAVVEAHNAFFERALYVNVFHRRYGWPLPIQWRCSAALAARHALPRALGACGKALGLDV